MQDKRAWDSKEAAKHYLKTVNLLIPRRNEILSIITRLATKSISDCPKTLDIGSGSGDIAFEIIKLKPHALVCAR